MRHSRPLSVVATISLSIVALACQRAVRDAAPAPAATVANASGYRVPPPDVVAILDAPPTPAMIRSPDRARFLRVHSAALPSLEEVAEPFAGLAGVRVSPERGARRRTQSATRFEIETVADGRMLDVATPKDVRLAAPDWLTDGKQFAFVVSPREPDGKDGVELWLGDAATGKTHRVTNRRLNDVTGAGAQQWNGDAAFLAWLVPKDRGPAPKNPRTPEGPNRSETAGRTAQVRTYQDLLKSAHDDQLFEHWFTSQLARVTCDGKVTEIGAPGIYSSAEPSPDGRFLLVDRVHGPWSHAVPFGDFAHSIEVWSVDGTKLVTIADLPVADATPIEGVPTGPRSVDWQPLADATLVWREALDEGDPRKKVEARDRLMMLAAPFTQAATEIARTKDRCRGVAWTDRAGVALVSEFDRDRRWITTTLRDLGNGGATLGAPVFDRSANDAYGDPGTPLSHELADGRSVVMTAGDVLWLAGAGASKDGERPFLDRLDLGTRKTERLFQSPADAHTSFTSFLDDPPDLAHGFIVRRESPSDPPNWFVRAADGSLRALTTFADPHPQLTGIHREIVTCNRADGVKLSGTLYLPPNAKPGERLPLVMWAYPLEYNDAATGGQVRSTANRFTRLSGLSPLLFLTQGYAVLDNAAMPVVGDPATMNDTFIEQIVASAKAEIDELDRRGVIDRTRVGVGGHSYGAFMTANLLANCDLFKAGIARSGAYNRTLTPFTFQSERRTLWEAKDTYLRMSPFMYADRLKAPLLMFHGEADSNPGTFPIQSRRLFEALMGLGGTARLVTLPNEDHGYAARESVQDVVAESFEWFDRYVKNAPPAR